MGKAIWLTNGAFFGQISKKQELWSKDGRCIGILNAKGQVFGPDGFYLAELLSDRLVVSNKNRGIRSKPFVPEFPQVGMPSYLPCSAIDLPEGYEAYSP